MQTVTGCINCAIKLHSGQLNECCCRDPEGILACCTHIPPLVQQNLTELHKLIKGARERPVEKVLLTFCLLWIIIITTMIIIVKSRALSHLRF